MPNTTYYKVLATGGTSCHGGKAKWHLPKRGKPGEWMPSIIGELEACRNGYHLCLKGDLPTWAIADWAPRGTTVYEAEVEGERLRYLSKTVVRRVRLTKRVGTWGLKKERALHDKKPEGRTDTDWCLDLLTGKVKP